jgi:hypothetical protein
MREGVFKSTSGAACPVEKHDAGRTPALLRIHVAYLFAVIAMALRLASLALQWWP